MSLREHKLHATMLFLLWGTIISRLLACQRCGYLDRLNSARFIQGKEGIEACDKGVGVERMPEFHASVTHESSAFNHKEMQQDRTWSKMGHGVSVLLPHAIGVCPIAACLLPYHQLLFFCRCLFCAL